MERNYCMIDGGKKMDENGNKKVHKTGYAMKYNYNVNNINRNYISNWGKIVSKKTKEYQKTLY